MTNKQIRRLAVHVLDVAASTNHGIMKIARGLGYSTTVANLAWAARRAVMDLQLSCSNAEERAEAANLLRGDWSPGESVIRS